MVGCLAEASDTETKGPERNHRASGGAQSLYGRERGLGF